jgi:hypothetical protein
MKIVLEPPSLPDFLRDKLSYEHTILRNANNKNEITVLYHGIPVCTINLGSLCIYVHSNSYFLIETKRLIERYESYVDYQFTAYIHN